MPAMPASFSAAFRTKDGLVVDGHRPLRPRELALAHADALVAQRALHLERHDGLLRAQTELLGDVKRAFQRQQ